ncbi:MAG: hypothetical protein K9K39_02750 [Desulfohalobiaceae bacterium]|nr:hypothetical protein [Desulfohalobiaceae bacterium]
MHQQYILAAVGSNRAGVVAEISEVLYQAGCNVENSFMTLLGEHFSLMIHLSLPADEAYQELQQQCDSLQKGKDFAVHLFPLRRGDIEQSRKARVQPHYDIRVRGTDKPGIVYRTSRLLASRGINILQMDTKVERSFPNSTPQFYMRIEIEVPQEVDGRALRRDLEALAEDLQESITLSRRQE